jgi:filamentous hemagglutinin family protein
MSRYWRGMLLTTSALVPLTLAAAAAGPNGASVVGGAATVQGQGTPSVVVNQTSQSAIINWNTFNIGAGETTRINMPSASSVELDRVTGGLGPSQIFGSLSSNGRVFLVNPDGILFGSGSRVNVGGLLATTHDISNADFMAGRYNFSISGNPSNSIINQGSITAQTGGFAALVAPGVRNTGTITATLGTIALASGNAFTLDLYGDQLIKLGVNDSIASQVIDVSTGKPLNSLVSNAGTLKANGGKVELTAVAARKVVDSVINNTGFIEANTIGTHNGVITLGAATATSKPAGAPTQTVKVSSTLSAAGNANGTTGGTVVVTGENIEVSGATINASGSSGGGAVLIGGDWGGGHPIAGLFSNPSAYLEPFTVPTASTSSIDATTTINASATNAGNGGKVVVWSDEATAFKGVILIEGGAQSGQGGFVETSGHSLNVNGGAVNASALHGRTGEWLLDPVVIDQSYLPLITLGAQARAEDYWGQSFAIGVSGQLEAISVLMDRQANATSNVQFYVFEIQGTAAQIVYQITVPNQNITTNTIGVSSASTYFNSMMTVDLSSLNIFVTPGQEWGFAVHSNIPGGNPQINLFYGCNNNASVQCGGPGTFNGYAGGSLIEFSNFNSINFGPTESAAFQTEILSGATPPVASPSQPSCILQCVAPQPIPWSQISFPVNGLVVPSPVISNLSQATGSSTQSNSAQNSSSNGLSSVSTVGSSSSDQGTVLSVSSTPLLTPGAGNAGQATGTLTIEFPEGSKANVTAYSNGSDQGTTAGNEAYQCSALIVRYANQLGITGLSSDYSNVKSGYLVAQQLASLSNGKFVYVTNGSSAAPVVGAVISINGFNTKDAKGNTDPAGHVGIVQHVTVNADGSLTVTLFDQNWPGGNSWSTVTFTKNGNSYSGTMKDSNAPGGVLTVNGWANPSGL